MPSCDVRIGDCREILGRIPEKSVDLVITSPPYKSADGYSPVLIRDMAREVRRVMKDGSRFWFNFGQLKEDYRRPFECVDILSIEFVQFQTLIWGKSIVNENGEQKGHYKPLPSTHILNYGFEFIFQFINGVNPNPLDRLAVGVPFTDPSNMARGNRGANGNLHAPTDVWIINHIEEDLWTIPYTTTGKTTKKDHEYQFPLELVRRLIRLSNLSEGATVLDPFYGSGSVGKVANELGFNAIGIELEKEKVKWPTL